MEHVRKGLPPMPARIAKLPVHRGYPVPWFVAWLVDGKEVKTGEGEPDFRIIGADKIAHAHNYKMCWVCGQPRGNPGAFVIGPMCSVNRVSQEPPSHVSCAQWSAIACPFLTKPHMVRREGGTPEDASMAGIGIMRNPGVAMVWITEGYKPFRVPNGVLFDVGNPKKVEFYYEGRQATRDEVLASIESGLPSLQEAAAMEFGGIEALNAQVKTAMLLLPAA